MPNEELDELQKLVLIAEGELIDALSDCSMAELVDAFQGVTEELFDRSESIEEMLEVDREYKQEIVFSTARVLKAILAEIEYRIRENKI
jgi:hypothetical protein